MQTTKRNITYRWLALLVSLVLMLTIVPYLSSAEVVAKEYSAEELFEVIEGIIQWKKESIGVEVDGPLLNNTFLENAGDTIGDWYPIGIGRLGYPDDYDAYLAVIGDEVRQRYLLDNRLSGAKATEWHRISLAILAMGGDPTNVGKDADGNPINLIADGTYNRGKVNSLGAQGINGWIWGLMTLDSMRYKVPSGSFSDRDEIITNILEMQLQDGGFSFYHDQADPDMTAMALQALAPYYNSEQTYTYVQKTTGKKVTKTVRQVADEALVILSDLQLEDGGYESWGAANAESTAQVLVALSVLGKDALHDLRFIKKGHTLVDGIMKYSVADGGFIHSSIYDPENPTSLPDESNSMASEQILYALISLQRLNGDFRSLYDFREEMESELKKQIKDIGASIEQIPESVSTKDTENVESIFKTYVNIPISERSYVFNYFKLANAMNALEIPNTSEPIAKNIGETEKGNGTITPIFNQNLELEENRFFTEEDAARIKELPKKLTTENYVEVVKLTEKLEKAENYEEYSHLVDELADKKVEIERIKDEIELLNNDVLDKLYPFSDLSIKDKKNVEEIVSRFEQLSPYDQKKVLSYEDVEKSKAQIDSLIRARMITIGLVVVVTVLIVSVLYRRKKRKKVKEMVEMTEDKE